MQETQNTQNSLEKEEWHQKAHTSQFQNYHKAVVSKTMW